MSLYVPRLPLQDLALAPASTKSYNKSLSSFLTHARLSPQQLLSAPAPSLDRLLAVYIQHSYDTSSPFTYAAHALHAIIFHRPDVKAFMFVSRQCIKGWERVKKTLSYPPLTWEVTVAIACNMAQRGLHGPAVAVLVGFDCYLRVGELTRIRFRDVVLPNDPRMGRAHSAMAVCLPRTKTGKNQSVDLDRQSVCDVLCAWIHRLSPTAKGGNPYIFAFSPDYLRRALRQSCLELGISHCHYVPHSLRHGGASADFLTNGSIARVQFRGRWKSMESLRTYVQSARALLAAQDVPPALNQLGMQLSDSLPYVMAHFLASVPEVTVRQRRVAFRL
jgi:integrase